MSDELDAFWDDLVVAAGYGERAPSQEPHDEGRELDGVDPLPFAPGEADRIVAGVLATSVSHTVDERRVRTRSAERTYRVGLALRSAAVILICLAVVIPLIPRSPSTLSEQLERAMASLGGGDQPLSFAELEADTGPRMRGALDRLYPSGVVLERRPVFRWTESTAVASVSLYRSDDGQVVWERGGVELPLPYPAIEAPLTRGESYTWALTISPARPELATTFTVAGESVRETYHRIDQTVEASLRSLVRAHLSLRLGLVHEAYGCLDEMMKHHPNARLALATRSRILRDLGLLEDARSTDD